MNIKSIFVMAAAALASVAMTSCDDWLDVNKNIDSPDSVDAILLFPNIQGAMGNFYWDIRATGPLTQMMGTSGYSNYANHTFNTASDAAGELWRAVYWLMGMNLENMIAQSLEEGNYHLAGIGYVMKAYGWDAMTKEHGDLPLKAAFEPGRLTHPYDTQDEIYEQVRKWALKGIEYLEMESPAPSTNRIAANDYFYGGNIEKWKKFGYAVLVRNLASLTNKNDFKEKYYNDLVAYAAKSFTSADDDAVYKVPGGGEGVSLSAMNNFWGPYRGNLSNSYWQHEYAVAIMTGTVPAYDEDGNKTIVDGQTPAYPYELNPVQIICDTLEVAGHLDPRQVIKLSTTTFNGGDENTLKDDTTTVWYKLRKAKYYGASFTSYAGSIGNAPTFYGLVNTASSQERNGQGRWIYRNDAPYILATYAEIMFDLAEAHFVAGNKPEAFNAWKAAIKGDMDFTAKYIAAGGKSSAGYHTGDWITAAQFKTLANEYLAGPFVEGLSLADFTLSHIMMQKFVALFPWGAAEAWVDQRKYMYDIEYTGEYPSFGNGWDKNTLNQKKDSDPTKVFKGFYLKAAQVQGRKSAYSTTTNNGSPCFRLRPRYNSEYMWNKDYLRKVRPIRGTADNYHTSIPWFAYPGEMPAQLPEILNAEEQKIKDAE